MRYALLALAACGGATPLPTGPAFALLEVGAQPRSVVRYDTTPDATERVAVTFKVRSTTKVENTVMEEGRLDVDLPGIRAMCVLTATAVSPVGDVDIRLVVEDANVLDDVVEPRARAVVAKVAEDLRGKRATVSRASSGDLTNIEVPEALDYIVRASALSFPQEPIGIGARWSRTSTIVVEKVQWYQTTTFTLRDRTSDTVTIDVATELRAGTQALHAEPNATTRLTGGTGRGSAHLVIPLRGLSIRGKADESRTLDVLITRGRTRIEAEITGEQFVSYDSQ